jgi:quercetin dioxygenase-like cupin family protein
MATIRFVRGEEREYVSIAEQAGRSAEVREAIKRMPGGELKGATFLHHSGGPTEPRLFEVKFPPGTKVEPHAHDADEIIVVTEGEIHFGKQVYGVGSSVFIPKLTLYSFQAGPEGLTFLNFRPTYHSAVILKDELMERRRQAQTTSA